MVEQNAPGFIPFEQLPQITLQTSFRATFGYCPGLQQQSGQSEARNQVLGIAGQGLEQVAALILLAKSVSWESGGGMCSWVE